MTQSIRLDGRPVTLNAERAGHWSEHRAETRPVRELAELTARGRVPGTVQVQYRGESRERLVPMLWAVITVEFRYPPPLADTGNNYPTAKAAIDGLVDAGVLFDDGPEFVREIRLLAPDTYPRPMTTVTLFGEVVELPWPPQLARQSARYAGTDKPSPSHPGARGARSH